ncbi:MAG: hypothetical protein V4760_02990, partial [Bdellovibrionota bacterium]
MKSIKLLVAATVLATSPVLLAQTAEGPGAFSYEGRLYDATTGNPKTGTVTLKLQILHPVAVSGAMCVIREEQVSVDLTSTEGYFSVAVGTAAQLTGSDPGNSAIAVFSNSGAITGFRTDNGLVCSPTRSGGMSRLLRVSVDDGSTVATLSPDVGIGTTPYAIAADSLQGFTPNMLLKDNAGANVTQANLEGLLTGAGLAKLQSLIAGSSSMYAASSASGGSKITTSAGTVASPVAGSIWVDTNTNQLMVHNGTGVIAVGSGGGSGTVQSIVAGSGLAGGAITTAGTISLQLTGVSAGTYGSASSIPWFTTDAFGRIMQAGSNALSLDASMIVSGTLSTTVLPIITVNKGGTNSPTALNNNRLMASSAGGIVEAPALSNGQIFIGSSGGAPVPANLTQGSGITITNSAGGITIAATGSGITSLGGLTGTSQTFAIGTSGTAPAWNSVSTTHTLNIPMASAGTVTAGLLSNSDWTTFNGKLGLAGGSMTGLLSLSGVPTINAHAANKAYVDSADNSRLSLAGGTLSGALQVAGLVWSTSGGIKFPDGSTQTTAATGGTMSSGLAGLSGDVVASGTGTVNATIQTGAVTFPKFQPLNGAKLVGNSLGSLSTAQEISIGAGLSLTGGVLSATGGGTGSSSLTMSGDLTGSGTGTLTATLANNVVTFPKFQQLNGTKLVGNSLGSLNTAQEIAIGAGLSLTGGVLSATGGGTGSSSLVLTGDIAASGVGTLATTIQNGVVTLPKIQNFNAFSLLGNALGSNSQAQQITVGAGLALAGGSLYATGAGTNATSTTFVGDVTGSGSGVVTLNIANISAMTNVGGLAAGTISSAISNMTSANLSNALVQRDPAGGFSAGTITALDIVSNAVLVSSGGNKVGFKHPGGGANYSLQLPTTAGSTGSYLIATGPGTLGWGGAGGGGDFMKDGSTSMTGQFKSLSGSSLVPGISFATDTDTGLFSPGANFLSIATGGASRMSIGSTGEVGIGTTATAELLHVHQTGGSGISATRFTTSGTGATPSDGVSFGYDNASPGAMLW